MLAGGPVQVAYAVDDVRAAAASWAAEQGAGPFFVREHIPVADPTFDHSSAYGWWGRVMVELVCVHEPAELAGQGLHHVAYFVDSFAEATAELTGRGWPAVLSTTAGTTNFAFHDARAELGHLVEIYEGDDRLRGFYAMVEAAADGWDGTDPVRVIG